MTQRTRRHYTKRHRSKKPSLRWTHILGFALIAIPFCGWVIDTHQEQIARFFAEQNSKVYHEN